MSPYHRDFILPNDRYGRELPQEPHVMYLQGASVKTTKAETLMATVKVTLTVRVKHFVRINMHPLRMN